MRNQLKQTLKQALLDKNAIAISTLRLVLAAIKDRDIAARSKGQPDGITDADIISLLSTMIKQRQDSAQMYEKGARLDLQQQELDEIEIITHFLPKQITQDELQNVIKDIVAEVGAASMRDMGKVMAEIRARYPGQANMVVASKLVKQAIGGD